MKIFRVIVTRLNGSRFALTTEDVSPEAAAKDIAALCGRRPTIDVRNIPATAKRPAAKRHWACQRACLAHS